MTPLHNRMVRGFALLLFFGFLFVPSPIPFRVVIIALAALVWTFLETREFKPIGLSRRRLGSTLIWGVATAVAVAAIGLVVLPLIERLTGMRSDLSVYVALVGNIKAALQLFAFMLVSAAIGEEILFRGFLLNQLTLMFGSGAVARGFAIVLGGVVFGAAHAVQGPVGMLSTGIVGMIFGWAWFRSGRNLWAMILAHALVDSYSIGMLYFGFYT